MVVRAGAGQFGACSRVWGKKGGMVAVGKGLSEMVEGREVVGEWGGGLRRVA